MARMSRVAVGLLIVVAASQQRAVSQDVLSPEYGRSSSTAHRTAPGRAPARVPPHSTATPSHRTPQEEAPRQTQYNATTPPVSAAEATHYDDDPFGDSESASQHRPQSNHDDRRAIHAQSQHASPRATAAIEPANLQVAHEADFDDDPAEAEFAAHEDGGQVQDARPLAITPRRSHNFLSDEPADGETAPLPLTGWNSLPGVLASLGFVLGLFFLVAWIMRRGMPGTVPNLSKNVVEVLGRVPMAGRQQMQLLRVGNKLILIHLSLAGAETLTEIDDPAEVDRIAGLCMQGGSHSSTRGFQDVLSQLGTDRGDAEFLDQDHGLELVSSGRGRRTSHGRDRRA